MWHYKAAEDPEDVRPIIEPELICTSEVSSGVTDICFLDDHRLVAGLENGTVELLQYSALSEVSDYLCG